MPIDTMQTGFYYLKTRYYNPEWGRFLNADGYVSTGQWTLGNNMYAYCLNNPVNMYDSNGQFAITIGTCIGAALITIGGFSLYLVTPAGQQSMQSLSNGICALIDKGKQLFRDIGNTISAGVDTIKATIGDIAESISVSFSKAQGKPRYKSNTELHHIVARNSPKALATRKILSAVGLLPDFSENIVEIKTGLHRRLHTNAYYEYVHGFIQSAYDAASGNAYYQAHNVRNALKALKAQLKALSAVSPW